MSADVVIETKHTDHPREQVVVQILHELAERYPLPWFTNHVRIAFGERPFSHPVLTLNTKSLDQQCVLRLFVHEQMHWFKDGTDEKRRVKDFFADHYQAPDLAEFRSGMNPEESFLEHIVVCWNTENYLRTHLSREDLAHSEQTCFDPYTKLNTMIRNQFEQIGRELQEYNMVAPV